MVVSEEPLLLVDEREREREVELREAMVLCVRQMDRRARM